MAFTAGLISFETYEALKKLRSIRNEAAHRMPGNVLGDAGSRLTTFISKSGEVSVVISEIVDLFEKVKDRINLPEDTLAEFSRELKECGITSPEKS